MTLSRIVTLSAALCLVGCKSSTLSQDHANDEATLHQLDLDWNKAAAAHSIDGWVSFYADDAVVLPPNEKTADTKEKIRASMTAFFTLPELNVSWTPTKTIIADAGDMAYLYGTYKLTAKDPASGKPIADTGKIVEVWRKQANGEWKCVLDTWNTDTPLPSA